MAPNLVADQQCLYHVNNSIILLKIWTISKYMRLGTRPLSGVISTLFNWMNSPISSTKNNMTKDRNFCFFLIHDDYSPSYRWSVFSNIKGEYFYSTSKDYTQSTTIVDSFSESDYWHGCGMEWIFIS